MSRVLIAYCIITSWPHLHHDSCPEITSPSFRVKRMEANEVVLLKQRRISEELQVLHRRRVSAGFGRNLDHSPLLLYVKDYR